MTWDMSLPPSSKQRRTTPETVRRQQEIATNARRETNAVKSGLPLPARVTRRRPRQGEPREVPVVQHEELWAFAATAEGRAINHHLLRVDPITQLRLLRAHRRCVRGEPGAWDGWVAILVELSR